MGSRGATGESLPRSLQGIADSGEFGVDFAGKTVKASDGDDGKKGSDQSVLNQVLARFIVQESAEILSHELSLRGMPAKRSAHAKADAAPEVYLSFYIGLRRFQMASLL
jgi:hypothetical protein